MARQLTRSGLRGHLLHRLDRDLQRYVIRDERVVVAVRRHWMGHIRPFLVSALTLCLAIYVDVTAPPTGGGMMLSQLLWFAWLASLVVVGWVVLNWRRDWFVATDKRFLMFYGFIHRRVDMMPLVKVTDLSFNRSILGRLFGYGDFTLESAGQHQALGHIDYIPHADEHYRRICEVLFGEDYDDDGSDGPDDLDGFGPHGKPPTTGRGGSSDGWDGGSGGGSGGPGRGPWAPAGPVPSGAPHDAARPPVGGPGGGAGDHDESDDGYDGSDLRAFGLPVGRGALRRSRDRRIDDSLEEVVYRSADRETDLRRADTDEIPVRPALRLPPEESAPRTHRRRRAAGSGRHTDQFGSAPQTRSSAREARTDELLFPPGEWFDGR